MLDRSFDQLTTKEKFRLQSIMKQHRAGQQLAPEDQALYERFSEDFIAAEKAAKGQWPIIIGLLAVSTLAILRKCSDGF